MDENRNENQDYHFSKKTLILAVLVMLLNVGFFSVVIPQKKQVYGNVAPVVSFGEDDKVMIKSPFDADFREVKSGQPVISGTGIKTGDSGYADLMLDKNRIRLDKNTDIELTENNFRNPQSPFLTRLSFRLNSGTVWVNAFDPILVSTKQSEALFSHTVGQYSYSAPMNRVFTVMGNVDMTFYDSGNNPLTSFVLPLKNQITYTDPQLIKDYARLEYSKLKKEFKMGPVPQTLLDEEWIKENTAYDISQSVNGDYIFSSTDYDFFSRYHKLRAELSVIPGVKHIELLNLAAVQLEYLLGGVNRSNSMELAKSLLSEFGGLEEKLGTDQSFIDFTETQFYGIRNIRTNTPSYLVKDSLRDFLFSKKKDTTIFRTYLSDIDFLLRVGELNQAEKVADKWVTEWKPELRSKYMDELNRESRIFQSIILAYIDKITPKFLSMLDDISDYRIKNSSSPEETLYEVAMERLEVSQYLVSAYRYTDAKTYLKTSYSQLDLAKQPDSMAAKGLFIQEGALLADRIAFAEQTLKGSAQKIDEAKFRDYLSIQERDKSIAERFLALIEESQKPVEIKVYPTVDDVTGFFAQNGITVLNQDVAPDSGNPFEFDISTGRFVSRAYDGSQIVFSATFDYSSKALFNIVINDIKGNLTMEDFVLVAKNGDKEVTTPNTPVADTSKVGDYLNLNGGEDALRSQIMAQDLAVQLMIKELEKYNVIIPSGQQVAILDKATLTEFKVSDVNIEDTATKRKAQVSFEYNSVTKIVSGIQLKGGISLDIPAQIKADDFTSTVFKALYGKEKEIDETTKAIAELSNYGFEIAAKDIDFEDKDFRIVDFKDVRLKSMPFTVTGTYNRNTKMLTKAENPLLTSLSIDASSYIKKLAVLWTIDYLASKGIVITEANITSALPADKVDIKNYQRGTKVIDMTFDVKSNKLINIKVQGISAAVPSMTFDEFSLVEGGSPVGQITNTTPAQSGPNGTCDDFADRLSGCVKYSCEFPDSETQTSMIRRITGLNGDKCRYIEQLPDSKYMECNFAEDARNAVAQQFSDQLAAGSILTGINFASDSGKTYTVSGAETSNPLQDAITRGECVVGNQ